MIKKILLWFTLSSFAFPAVSLTMDAAIQKTLRTSPDILISTNDRKAIEQALEQAKAAYFPKIKLNMGLGLENTRNSSTEANPNGPTILLAKREMGIALDQSLFDGFATTGEVARNSAKVSSATYKTLNNVQESVKRCIETYFSVLQEIELVALARENLDFHAKITKMIERRTKSGISRAADLFQAKGRLSLAQSNLLAEISNLNDAKANFFRVTGLLPNDLSQPQYSLKKFTPTNLEHAIKIGIKNNPVILSATADIEAAVQQHKVAGANHFPRFDLQAGVTQDSNVGGVRGPSNSQFAMIRMTYNLYSGGADIGRQRETAFQLQQAKEIKQRAITELIEAIKLTWHSLETAKKQLPWLKSHRDSAQKTVSAYQKQLEVGQRPLLDFLDSENELFAAKRAFTGGKYEAILTEFRLLSDIGLLLTALNVHP